MERQKTLTEYIRYFLYRPLEDGRLAVEHVAAQIVLNATKGDKAAMQVVLDRTEGRVPVAEAAPIPKEPLSDELEHAIDTIYKNSEDGGQSEGTGL